MKRALPEFIIRPNFKRRAYSDVEKTSLLKYMKTSGDLHAAAGYVDDIVKGIITSIECGGYRDDEYEWSDQDTYHIEKYDAAVTDEFLEHVMRKAAG